MRKLGTIPLADTRRTKILNLFFSRAGLGAREQSQINKITKLHYLREMVLNFLLGG